LWAAGDIVENRPPLSRWHPDYADKFKAALTGQ
ncbi:MAG: short-chain dehydrogenase, partial [Rhizobium sp.]|nr:short-chain dehydrogenase [Rhizobium sp.]